MGVEHVGCLDLGPLPADCRVDTPRIVQYDARILTTGSGDWVPRRLIPRLRAELLPSHPAVLVVGARGVGKTSMLTPLAASAFDLTVPQVGAAVQADPDAFLEGLEEPVLIDEWQAVPEVLGAIKRQVDRHPDPGRYLISGSVRAHLMAPTWPLTGRAIRVAVHPFSQGEMDGTPDAFVDVLLEAPRSLLSGGYPSLDRNDYLERAVRGGFPLSVLSADSTARARWLDAYVEDVVTRDAVTVGGVRTPRKLQDVLRLLAGRTAQLLNLSTVADQAAVARDTAAAHLDLLMALFLVHRLEPWAATTVPRLTRTPKIHVADSGLACRLAGADLGSLRRDATAAGHILESFAVMEIVRQLEWADTKVRASHYRDRDQREIDLVLEGSDNTFVAIEVKAGARVDARDLTALRHLRERLGSAFHAGVVLHTGTQAYPLDDHLVAAPLSALWTASRL